MVLPAADALDTTVNEADPPMFLVDPSLARVRSLVPPVLSASVPPEAVPRLTGSTRLAPSFKYSPLAKFADNRQPLLCTFLI